MMSRNIMLANNDPPKDGPKCLFEFNGSFITFWEIFIILVAIVNSITIPFQIFYQEDFQAPML